MRAVYYQEKDENFLLSPNLSSKNKIIYPPNSASIEQISTSNTIFQNIKEKTPPIRSQEEL